MLRYFDDNDICIDNPVFFAFKVWITSTILAIWEIMGYPAGYEPVSQDKSLWSGGI